MDFCQISEREFDRIMRPTRRVSRKIIANSQLKF